MHGVKVPFFITGISISKIISHRFYFNDKLSYVVIYYYMIIGHDLMVQLIFINGVKYKVI